MSTHPDDVVMVASGTSVSVQFWREALEDAGIECRVVGDELTGGIGSALPATIELWVHRRDFDKAQAAIRFAESNAGKADESESFGRPVSDPKPATDGQPNSPYRPNPRDTIR